MAQTISETELTETDIHDILSNERRRLALQFLRDAGGELTARELSERIAEVETGESPPPRNIRQSAYISLHQTHLPKLDDLEIVAYDADSKYVELQEQASEVSVYMETVPKYGISWSEFYLGVAILGLLTAFGADFGVPVLAAIPPVWWAYVFFALVGIAATYQTIQQGSSLLHRIRARG